MTMRPYSANVYALSKVWFKCSSVKLRVQLIQLIQLILQKNLCYIKTVLRNKLVLFRKENDGGLGLMCIKI